MEQLILITGGARSGKSSFALELAESIGPEKLFVATCPKIDPEMSDRVNRHRTERVGRGWQTYECERELENVFDDSSAKYDVILIDCITLWVNNIMFARKDDKDLLDDSTIKELCSTWIQAAENFPGTLICVTNEVGLGIVPDNTLARRYRDLVGTCNQLLGKTADQLVLVSCGVSHYLKR